MKEDIANCLEYIKDIFHTNPIRTLAVLRSIPNQLISNNMLEQIFIKGEYRLLYEAILPDTILLDLGAWIGDTSIYFAMNNKVRKVLAYEPSTDAFKHLSDNTKQYEKIEIHNEAVMSESGFVNNTLPFSTSNSVVAIGDGAVNAIKSIALSELLSKYKNQRIAIKCDIEGGERNLFGTNLSSVYAMELEIHANCYESVKYDLEKANFKLKNLITEKGSHLLFAIK